MQKRLGMQFILALSAAITQASWAEQRLIEYSLGDQSVVSLAFEPASLIEQRSALEFDGVVEAINRAVASAQTSGRIVELPFDLGDRVEQGDVIARLTQGEQQAGLTAAQALLREAQTAYAEADRQWRRLLALYEKKLVAVAPVDNAKQVRDAAAARVASAQAAVEDARTRLDYTEVVAPYSGIVVSRPVSEGEAVMPGTPLLEGVALDQLRIRIKVPQTQLPAIRERINAELLFEDGSRQPLDRVRFVPTADPTTHAFTILIDLPEVDQSQILLPGMLMRVAFYTDSQLNLSVPVQAIARRGELNAVYVADEQGKDLEFRYIRVGESTNSQLGVIESGLAAGEWVALDPVAAGIAYKGQKRGEH